MIMATRTTASGQASVILSMSRPRRSAAAAGSLPSVDIALLEFMSFVPAWTRTMFGLWVSDGPTLSVMNWIVLPDQAACKSR